MLEDHSAIDRVPSGFIFLIESSSRRNVIIELVILYMYIYSVGADILYSQVIPRKRCIPPIECRISLSFSTKQNEGGQIM